MPPLLLGWQQISCYENRIDACGVDSLGVRLYPAGSLSPHSRSILCQVHNHQDCPCTDPVRLAATQPEMLGPAPCARTFHAADAISQQPSSQGKILQWHAAGRVSPWSNNKRRCPSSGRPSAHRSRPSSSNATGNARACFFPGNASLNNCRQPATLGTANFWSRRLRSWIVNSRLLNRLRTRRHQSEWPLAHTSHNENHGPVRCPLTYN